MWLWSDGHGETSVTVGADGTWQGSLTYTNVKVGDTFATKARDTTGGTSIYFEVTITE